MPAPVKKVSLDQIMSERQFSVKSTDKGDTLTKIYKAPASWNPEERSARFVMTAEVVDRYGDVVVAKGVDWTEFVRNPVALWAHNNRGFPIGQWADLKLVNGTPKRVEGTCVLHAEGTTEDGDAVARLIAAGSVRACSIGFMPKSWESIKDDKDRWTGYRFLESELLECSPCSVPANPAAIVKAAGGDEGLAMQAIELVLDEWTRTPDGIIVPRKAFEDAYTITRNKEVTLHEVRAIEEAPGEEDTAPEVTSLDIQAAVSKGISEALSSPSLWDQVKKAFGLSKDQVEETAPAPIEPETKEAPAEESDDGETEEAFQARMAAAKALEDEQAALADEEDERKLRERAATLAA